jgi:hypothetical protein
MSNAAQTRREFLSAAGKYAALGLGAAPALSALLSGCGGVATTVGSLGNIGAKVESAMKVGKAVAKGFQDITPQQEYYIGRTVGAMILA